MSSHSAVALKEWQVVVDELAASRQIVLLRKGGVIEEHGQFRLEHPEFFLYSTYVHQSAGSLKPEFAERVQERAAEPTTVSLNTFAVVTDILHPKGLSQVLAIEPFACWHSSLLHMRWNYKPQNPLFLLLVRAFRLPSAHEMAVTAEHAGCRSWVKLDAELSTAGATPALDDAEYERRREEIVKRVG